MLSRRALFVAAAAASLLPAGLALAQEEGGNVAPDEIAKQPGTLKDISLGKPDAPVKVYEYASMTCGHCANFSKNTFPAIKEKYIDTGKVYWTMREFPLDPLAAAAFMLARCAGDDRYYTMMDVLFEQQETWAFQRGEQAIAALLQISRQAGMSQEQFDKCLNDKEAFQSVNTAREIAGTKFKVNGTPTFFINGVRKGGELTIEEFSAVVDPMVK